MEYYSSSRNQNFFESPDPETGSESDFIASETLPLDGSMDQSDKDESFGANRITNRTLRLRKSKIIDSDSGDDSGDDSDDDSDDSVHSIRGTQGVDISPPAVDISPPAGDSKSSRGTSKRRTAKEQPIKSESRASSSKVPKPRLDYDVLLGVWKYSEPEFDVDKMAVYGGWWSNKAVKFQVFKFTIDGRPVNGEFPYVASRRCPWVKFQDIKLLPDLNDFNEKELKNYVRASVKPLQGRRQDLPELSDSSPHPADVEADPRVTTSSRPEANNLASILNPSGSGPSPNMTNSASPRSMSETFHHPAHEDFAPTTTTPDQVSFPTQQEYIENSIFAARTHNNVTMGSASSNIITPGPENMQPPHAGLEVAADSPDVFNTESSTYLVNTDATTDKQSDEISKPASQRSTSPASSKSVSSRFLNNTVGTSIESMAPARETGYSLPLSEVQRDTFRTVRSTTPSSHSDRIEEVASITEPPSSLGKRLRFAGEHMEADQHDRRPPPPPYRSSTLSDFQLKKPGESYKVPDPRDWSNKGGLEKCRPYDKTQIQEYREYCTSKHQDVSKFNDRHISLIMMGSLYPALVKENRAMGRKVEVPHTSPVPQPTKDFIFSSVQVKAYRDYCQKYKSESIQHLTDVQLITIMLGELYGREAAVKKKANYMRLKKNHGVENVEKDVQIESPRTAISSSQTNGDTGSFKTHSKSYDAIFAAPTSIHVSPYSQPDEESPDGSWIRFNNIVYTLCKEEPLKNKYLATPYKLGDLGGDAIIEYELLEVVKKKAVLLHNGIKFQKVMQVPRVVMKAPTLKRRKLLLHDSEIEAAAKFVRLDGFKELGDKWVRSTQIIEKIEDDKGYEMDENAGNKDQRTELESQN